MKPHLIQTFGLLITFISFIAYASSSALHGPCDADVDCFHVKGNCVKVAETCDRGVCTCVAPFIATSTGVCRRGISPWRRCNIQAGDVCVGKNFQCIDGQCQCRPGLFPVGDSCVQMAQITTSLGSTCSDNSNCLPGMECRQWLSSNGNAKDEHVAVTICQCPITHRVLNNTQCVPRRLGDPCGGSNSECGLILDGICSPETMSCSCPTSHQATQTLLNMSPQSEASSWQLVDACRPLNGATKRVGQRCTNSLQCQYGHMCARCEPKNLSTPKTCNRPACSSAMCRNQTCPLCEVEPMETSSTSSSTTKTTATTEIISTAFIYPESRMADNEQGQDQEAAVQTPTTEVQPSSTILPNFETAEARSETNIALAISLPIVFLAVGLIGIFLFVRYAWGRLNWKRRSAITKCVEALETSSSSASSGLSMNRNQSYSGESNLPELPTTVGLSNVSFYDRPSNDDAVASECNFTQASATMLMRELEEEANLSNVGAQRYPRQSVQNMSGSHSNFSALTMNYNSSTLVNYRNKQNSLSQSMHHINQHGPTSRQDAHSCPKHKYCVNNAIDDFDVDSDYATGSEMPPKLPPRSRSIRAYAPSSAGSDFGPINNHHHHHQQLQHHRHDQQFHQQWPSGIGSNLVTSRLDIDRRKSLQY